MARACGARVLPVALLLLAGLGAGCADGSGGAETADPEAEAPAPAWNPCSSLEPAVVSETYATTFATRVGSADAPTCTFAPQSEGEPVLDVNYQLFAGSLGELLETFGETEEEGRTSVLTPTVPGADDARLIVDTGDDTFVLTGFVQSGPLVQIVNVLDPAPYDRDRLLNATETVMADLAAGAGSSGLTGD